MTIRYDKEADAMYITLLEGAVHHTQKMSQDFLFDLDKSGNVLGIEIVFASAHLPKGEVGKVSLEMPVLA